MQFFSVWQFEIICE